MQAADTIATAHKACQALIDYREALVSEIEAHQAKSSTAGEALVEIDDSREALVSEIEALADKFEVKVAAVHKIMETEKALESMDMTVHIETFAATRMLLETEAHALSADHLAKVGALEMLDQEIANKASIHRDKAATLETIENAVVEVASRFVSATRGLAGVPLDDKRVVHARLTAEIARIEASEPPLVAPAVPRCQPYLAKKQRRGDGLTITDDAGRVRVWVWDNAEARYGSMSAAISDLTRRGFDPEPIKKGAEKITLNGHAYLVVWTPCSH